MDSLSDKLSTVLSDPESMAKIAALAKSFASSQKNKEEKADFDPIRPSAHAFREASMEEKNRMIKENPAYGRIVCRCETVSEGEIRDARNIGFLVRYDSKSGLTRLYPKKIHSVPRLPGFHDFFDLTRANWNAEDTDSFNFERELS